MSSSERQNPRSFTLPRRSARAGWFGVPLALWAAVVLAVVLAWLAQVLAARGSVNEQATLRNQQAAEQLAARLGTEGMTQDDAQARLAALAASGQVRSLYWTRTDGSVLAEVGGGDAAPVPAWFMHLAPITPLPGRSVLPWQGQLSEFRVQLALAPTWTALWRSALAAAWGALAMGAIGLAVLSWTRRGLAASLAALEAQLRGIGAVADGESEARVDDSLLHPIAEAVARAADQRASLLAAHAEQMEALRRHAHVDAVTGLPNRRAFVGQLGPLLGAQGEDGAGLLLLRVRDLYGLNLRLGHVRTDETLQALAELLRAFPRQVGGSAVGRLNGSDFAIALPAPGLALETAQSVLAAVRPLLGPLDGAAGLAIGAAELRRPAAVGDALALADTALARAEISGRFALELVGEADGPALGGQSHWPQALRAALDDDRIEASERGLRTADGRVLLNAYSLALQLEPDGAFEPAARWLPLATRTQVSADIEERAIEMALRAIGGDGLARSIDVSLASLQMPGFIERVARLLAGVPGCAFRLCIDLAESTARDHPELVREASSRWRPSGAMLALCHAGEALARRPQLLDLGLDCVRIDARYVEGVSRADGESARRYLGALVHMVQGVGLQITAEGVRSGDDLTVLWSLGFDAAWCSAAGASVAEVDLPLDLDVTPQPEAEGLDLVVG